jgi:histidinol-phosphate aminotransferase
MLSFPMQTKPPSKREARSKSSSTPRDVIRMCFNESQYGMSPYAMQALVESAGEGNHYQDWFAVQLKQAIAEHFDVSPMQLVTASGSSAVIDMIGTVFLNPGDEVVFCMPTYEAFKEVAYDYGAVCITPPLDENNCYDLDAMLEKITDKTKMVVVCNPNNPTGTYVPAEKLEAFIRKVPDHVLTIIDEAYMEYAEAPDCTSVVHMLREGYDKPLIILKTFSKIYGLAGVRVGYGIMPEAIADHLLKSTHGWNLSRLGEYAATAAMKDQAFIEGVKVRNARNRAYVSRELEKLGCIVTPSQTSFVYFDAHIPPAELRAQLAEYKILISAFDKSRVSLGKEEQNDIFLDSLNDIMKGSKKKSVLLAARELDALKAIG